MKAKTVCNWSLPFTMCMRYKYSSFKGDDG